MNTEQDGGAVAAERPAAHTCRKVQGERAERKPAQTTGEREDPQLMNDMQ